MVCCFALKRDLTKWQYVQINLSNRKQHMLILYYQYDEIEKNMLFYIFEKIKCDIIGFREQHFLIKQQI